MSRDCETYQEKLSAFLDGRLSSDEAAGLKAHLESCPECASLLKRMKTLGEIASEAMLEIDDAVLDKLEKRIADELDSLPEKQVKFEAPKSKVTPIWYRYVGIAATIVLVFSVGHFALKDSNRSLWDNDQIPIMKPSPVPTEIRPSEAADRIGGESGIEQKLEEDAIGAGEKDDQEIVGRIVDQKTGEGVAGATVMIEGTNRGAKSDSDGEFVISSVPADTYNLIFTELDYQPVVVEDVAVERGETSRQNIQMSQSTVESGQVISVSGQKKEFDLNQRETTGIEKPRKTAPEPMAEEVDLRGAQADRSRSRSDEFSVHGVELAAPSALQKTGAGQKMAMPLALEGEEEKNILADLYASAVAEYKPPTSKKQTDLATETKKDSMAVYWFVVFDRTPAAVKAGETAGLVERYYLAARSNYDLYRITSEDSFFNRSDNMRKTALKLIVRHLKDKPDDSLILRYQYEINAWPIKK